MAVAADHLRRDRVWLQAEPLAGDPLDLGVDRGVGANGSGQLSDTVRVERTGEARPVAIKLERPPRELPAERRRLGVDAVGPADANRVPVLFGPLNHGRNRAVEPLEEELAAVLDLQRKSSVDDVRRREAVVDPTPFFTELLR